MKRSVRLSIAVTAVSLAYLATTGFQCSSPNITSGKMYYQQYDASAPKDTNKLNMALEMFRKETMEKPNSAEAWYWLGFVHGIKKQYLDLVDAWNKSKSFGPQMQKEIETNSEYFWGQAYNDGAFNFQKAQMKKDKALFAKASNAFKAATLLEPDSAAKYGAYVNLAYSLFAQDNATDAVAALLEQNRRLPNPDVYRLLGQIYTNEASKLKKDGKTEEAQKKYNESIAFLNEGVSKFPKNVDLNQELLNSYVLADRIVEAKPRFKAFADDNPTDKLAQYAYGTVLLETKEYEEAITYLNKAIAIDPKFENALYNASVAYLRLGIKLRDEESAANPDKSVTAYKAVMEKAVPYLQTLTTIKPDVLANWDLSGKIYAALGMTKEAEMCYKKADELRGK